MGKSQHIALTAEQRQELEQLIRSGDAPARVQTRARILLLSASDPGAWRSAPKVAQALLVHPNTVRSIRQRFVAAGLTGALYDRPRPGAEPKLTGAVEAQLTLLACSRPPEGHAEWSLRLLADQLVALGTLESVSHTTVGDWLKKTRSNPGA